MITAESPDVQIVATAMSTVDDDLRTGDLVGPAVQSLAEQWAPTLGGLVESAQDQAALVDGARALVEGGSLVLDAAVRTVPLSGGLVPSTQGAAVEFGSNVQPGLPPKTPAGRIVMPAARQFGEQYVTVSDEAIGVAYRRAVGDEG